MPKNAPKKINSKEARRKAKTRLKMLVFPKMAKINKAKKRKEALKRAHKRYFCPFFFEVINEAKNALK